MNQKTEKFLEWSFILTVISAFLGFKLANLTFHFGDSNVYFYMAKAVLDGNLPYRDFFLADPPAMVFLLAGLRFLFGNRLILYQALPVILEAATALILYLLLKRAGNKMAYLLVPAYLFSFSVLALSDYLTGVQLVVFFSVLGIFFWEEKKPFWSGVFWALSFLTKLYGLMAFGGFLFFALLKKERPAFIKLVFGAVLTVVFILGPLAIISLPQMVNDLIIHHLHRPAGLNKADVFVFFLKREWFLLALAAAGGWLDQKKIFVFPFLFSLIFLLLFQDLYYTYLGPLLSYLVVLALLLTDWFFSQATAIQDIGIFLGIVWLVFLVVSFNYYYQTNFIRGRFLNAPEIAGYIKTLPNNLDLYGSHEVAPLVALFGQKRLFKNYIDTNTQVFGSRTLDLEKVSRQAAQAGVLLLARITDRPEYGLKDEGYQGYFSPAVFKESCQRLKEFPSTANESDNHLVVYRCFKR